MAIVQERWQPLGPDAAIEVFDLDSPDNVIATQTVDTGGVATFTGLPDNQRYFFKPRLSRYGGQYGERDTYGEVKLQILASSGSICADFVVDASGQWGTHTTIQAALNDGNTSGHITIFIMAGIYSEKIVFNPVAGASFTIVGCNPYINDWPGWEDSSTQIVDPLEVIIDGTTGIALDYSDVTVRASMTWIGIHFRADNVGTVIDGGRGTLIFKECVIENENATGIGFQRGGVAGTGTDVLYFDHCILSMGVGGIALTLLGTSLVMSDCRVSGQLDYGSLGGVKLSDCAFKASTDPVIDLNSGLILTEDYSITGCHIMQTSTGSGIFTGSAGVAASHCYWHITGNVFQGAGSGTSNACIASDAASIGIAVGNTFSGWANGVDIPSGAVWLILSNLYCDVTNPISGAGEGESGLRINAEEAANAGILTVLTGAPIGAAYVTIGNDATLTAERALTDSASISVTDGGVNSTVTLAVIPAGVDHGGLAGLADDDHSAYALHSHSFVTISAEGRMANERVLTGSASISVTDDGAGTTVTLTANAAGVDHGGLAGLADDDHMQYLLLLGRSGGQTAIGGTAAGNDLTLQATSNAASGTIIFLTEPGVAVANFEESGGEFAGYLRAGALTAPINTTDGDLTAVRLFITDTALNSEARLFQVSDTFTPVAGAFNSMYILTNVNPGVGLASDEIRAAKFEVNVRPTANYVGAARAFFAEADHDSGVFNVAFLTGFFAQSVQRIAATTVMIARSGRLAYRAAGGTITTAIGLDIDKGISADAGAIGTGTGIRIGASTGVTPTTDISIQALGAAHMRHVGPVNFGTDATPTNTTAGDLTAIRLVIPDATLGNGNIVRIADDATAATGLNSIVDILATSRPGGENVGSVALSASMDVQPTAADTGNFYGMRFVGTHTAGAFDLGDLLGMFAIITAGVNTTTVDLVNPIHAEYTVTGGGTITLAVGVDITRTRVSGTLTTSIGLRIAAHSGVTANDIAIQSLGGQNRFVGATIIGADSAPTSGKELDVRGDIEFTGSLSLGGTPSEGASGEILQSAGASTPPEWNALSSVDHGAWGGLSDDDHTIYALLLGRSGGQTLIGGTAAGNLLVLQSTSNSTRGAVQIGNADGSGDRLILTAMDGTNEGGEITINGSGANIDWTWDSSAGNLRWFENGQVRMQLNTGTPGAGKTNFFLHEGAGPTQRRVQQMDPGAAGANFAGGEMVMILV